MASIIKEVLSHPAQQHSNASDASSGSALKDPISHYYFKFREITDLNGLIEKHLVEAGVDHHSLFVQDYLACQYLMKHELGPGDINLSISLVLPLQELCEQQDLQHWTQANLAIWQSKKQAEAYQHFYFLKSSTTGTEVGAS
ncbi:uncharacterized protein MELLADRAFT_105017 [Melampsora larici-populina 98AG31]|uniref:Uncharacterized protein n=1 Tax=Melampsora larici-populina (strain 98AG31 / pathotype 3-4-7) TaxID=747676 RepID=F4RGN8_MELLP|nr:uncharacterized protein MELLADRAFT_105017 [Melampsora larici-populina 98AG31]EGG08567.1 hypothetical protein MELLADRAFT_105017 [Melampsora larici-populina 98AG31]